MYKRGLLISFLMTIALVSGVYAASDACSLSASLINQDPYPATPEDYVKVVFQLEGVKNPDCNRVLFQIIPEYPFSLDSGQSDSVTINSGTFISSDYKSFLLIPYKLRVDKDALDGENKIKVKFARNVGEAGKVVYQTQDFNITIDDQRTDFEVSIQDYVESTNTFTLGIVNIGKNDAEALTMEIPAQNNIEIRGARISVIGSLDSNDDTTASFTDTTPREGDIKVIVAYNDQVGVRRTLEKTVTFTKGFVEKNAKKNGQMSTESYMLIASWILFIVVAAFLYIRRRKRLAKEKLMRQRER